MNNDNSKKRFFEYEDYDDEDIDDDKEFKEHLLNTIKSNISLGIDITLDDFEIIRTISSSDEGVVSSEQVFSIYLLKVKDIKGFILIYEDFIDFVTKVFYLNNILDLDLFKKLS